MAQCPQRAYWSSTMTKAGPWPFLLRQFAHEAIVAQRGGAASPRAPFFRPDVMLVDLAFVYSKCLEIGELITSHGGHRVLG